MRARLPARARPDINVTPLVDVVLVLLIIFMIIVPQMEAGASVNLPGIQNPDTRTDPSHTPLTVSVTADGRLFLEKQMVERANLVELLEQHRAAAPGRRLILKGDKAARYADVRAIFDDSQAIGFPGISLQVGDEPSQREEN